MDDMSGATYLITGGTGSFGQAVLGRILENNPAEIRIFSRDEKKQDDLRKRYSSKLLKFYLGDVRDEKSMHSATDGVDFLFHAAALKQVPSCEFFPMEAVKTNILGTENVLNAAIRSRVRRVVCLSTDKAVYPINAMGISKAMMEKVMVAVSRSAEDSATSISGTRYGNVLASRGSVVPLFVEQIKNKMPLTITDPEMTRFIMSLQDAVDLVLFAFANGNNGDTFVQKAPATTIGILAEAVCQILGKKDYPIEIIGKRHGEKAYESLIGSEELYRAEDLGIYFRICPDARDLNYDKFTSNGMSDYSETLALEDYNSANTRQLDLDATIDLLLGTEYMQSVLKAGAPGINGIG